MKFIKYIILTFVIFHFTSSLSAQGPGFMGNHFYLSYDGGAIRANGEDWRLKHTLSLNYILQKRWVLGLNYDVFKFEYFDQRDDTFSVMAANGVGFKTQYFFQKYSIAPVGPFFSGEITRYTYKAEELIGSSVKGIGFKLGGGVSRVLFKRLVVQVSTHGSFDFAQKYNTDIEDYDLRSTVNNLSDEAEDFNILLFNISIGLMLF